MFIPHSISTLNALPILNKEITDSIGSLQRSLNQLNITPELLSLNCQNISLAAAEAQFALEREEIPVDPAGERAIVMTEMVFAKHATKCLQKSNTDIEERVSHLREELQLANEEYFSMNSLIDIKDESQLKYFILKQNEYVKRAVALNNKMIRSGITAIGLYKSVIDHSINVSRSKAQLAEVEKKLAKYGNLPPDIQEAKLKLTEAKTKFKELEQNLRQKIVANI